MRKMQLWSMFKEITSHICDWDEEMFQKSKNSMTFVKYLPMAGQWGKKSDKYLIKIKIDKEEVNEEEDSIGKSTQSVEKI